MMEQIADVGNGNYSYIDSAMEAGKVLDEELPRPSHHRQDVKIQIEFNPAIVSEYRLIGYENRLLREEDFSNDAVDAGDIGAGHRVTALYEIIPAGAQGWLSDRRYEANRPQGRPRAAGEAAFLQLRYKLPGEEQSRLIQQPIAASSLAAARPRRATAFAAAVAAFGQKLKATSDRGFAGPDPSLAGEQTFSVARVHQAGRPCRRATPARAASIRTKAARRALCITPGSRYEAGSRITCFRSFGFRGRASMKTAIGAQSRSSPEYRNLLLAPGPGHQARAWLITMAAVIVLCACIAGDPPTAGWCPRRFTQSRRPVATANARLDRADPLGLITADRAISPSPPHGGPGHHHPG